MHAGAVSGQPADWLLKEWGDVVHAAAPLRRLFRRVPLPDAGMTVSVPTLTAAAGVVVATGGENVAPPESVTATSSLTVNVSTFYGEVHISQQLWERGPNIDRVIMRDMAASYAQALESQLISGSGTGGELLGLLNVAGATLATWTVTTPTPAELVAALAGAAGQVADARLRPPSWALTRPSRWFWTAGVADASSEPTVRPGTGLVGRDPDIGPVGPIAGLPIYLDAEIPSDLGTGGNEDVIILGRGADLLLLEGTPRFEAFVDTSGGPSELAIVVAFHVYATAIPHRYPAGIGILSGTGLAAPAGF